MVDNITKQHIRLKSVRAD